jgi:hypothetical protein
MYKLIYCINAAGIKTGSGTLARFINEVKN